MRRSALVCLLDKRRVLLAQKRDGGGVGLWTPHGGGIKRGETASAAAVRELYEESTIKIEEKNLFHAAIITTYRKKVIDYRLSVFTCRKWIGLPVDTDEMHNARWFGFNKLPLDQMRPTDREWLPRVLAGEVFCANVHLTKTSGRYKKIEYHTFAQPA